MSEKTISLAIENAARSVEMEGFSVDEQTKKECRRLIRNEITLSEYIDFAKKRAGIG